MVATCLRSGRILKFLSSSLAVVVANSLGACSSPSSVDAGDAGDVIRVDVPSRPDFINVNCSSAAGDEGAADCNQRLVNMTGAHFFVGGASQCYPDPNSTACVPMCTLDDINPANCTFSVLPPGTGCRYAQPEGYRVVVEATSGLRWTAAVATDGNCAAAGTAQRRWARVRFADLTGAADCIASMPAGGFGAPRFLACSTAEAACGPTLADTCQALDFMGAAGRYTANVCTRACSTDVDCGARGACYSGTCFARCGGACSLSCDAGFDCRTPMGASTDLCLPSPP